MSPAIGYAIREQNRPILDDPAINAAEMTFERTDDPLRVDRYIQELDFDYTSVHALKLSVCSPEPPNQKYLDSLKTIALENDAVAVSDHLGFTRDTDGGVEIGHFAPPPYTEAALKCTCRNIARIQQYFGEIRFYVENIAYLFQFDGTMSEAKFLGRVLNNTGCGWLLDVTNVYANAMNFGYDSYQFIEEVMSATNSVQMHLAGGYYNEQAKMYLDSHSHPIPEEVWDLYEYSLELANGRAKAVFIERDQNFPDEDGWRQEIHKAREIADAVGAIA